MSDICYCFHCCFYSYLYHPRSSSFHSWVPLFPCLVRCCGRLLAAPRWPYLLCLCLHKFRAPPFFKPHAQQCNHSLSRSSLLVFPSILFSLSSCSLCLSIQLPGKFSKSLIPILLGPLSFCRSITSLNLPQPRPYPPPRQTILAIHAPIDQINNPPHSPIRHKCYLELP